MSADAVDADAAVETGRTTGTKGEAVRAAEQPAIRTREETVKAPARVAENMETVIVEGPHVGTAAEIVEDASADEEAASAVGAAESASNVAAMTATWAAEADAVRIAEVAATRATVDDAKWIDDVVAATVLEEEALGRSSHKEEDSTNVHVVMETEATACANATEASAVITALGDAAPILSPGEQDSESAGMMSEDQVVSYSPHAPAGDVESTETAAMHEAEAMVKELKVNLRSNHARVIDLFRSLDVDSNGVVDAQELKLRLSQLRKDEPATSESMAALLDMLDADHSQTLSYDELHAALRRDDVVLPAALRDGAVGPIATESKNRISLNKR